ncbi:MAG: hypothetical protein WD040_00980 [Anaerolineales bacterium]
MPKPLSLESPNLKEALTRLTRTLRVWAVLQGTTGLLTLYTNSNDHPFEAVPWLVAAALTVTGRQPAYLALVAFQWGISLASFLPGVRTVFGADPLVAPPDVGPVGIAGLALVRVLFLVTAWNQFMLYRLLYGTENASGLDPKMASIPEIVPNHTDTIALIARALGGIGLIATAAAVFLSGTGISGLTLGLARASAILAIGLGLGAAFSPTRRRGTALTGIGTGAAGFLLSLALGRVL